MIFNPNTKMKYFIIMKKLKTLVILLVSVAVFSACNGLTGSSSVKTAKTQLSVQTASASSSVTPVAGTSSNSNGGTTTSTSGSTIKIDTAKVLIKKVEFHNQIEDSTEFEAGPFILDLNMDTTVTQIGISNMPHGTYTSVSFEIHKPEPGNAITDSDFVAGPKEDQKYSVVVKGFYNGKHFVFKSQRSAEEHIKLNPPLIVSDTLSSYNATIQVNVNSWFTGRNGSTLDPTNPQNAEMIDRAIQRSFRGFKDNNEDGHEDSSKTESENHDKGNQSGNHKDENSNGNG